KAITADPDFFDERPVLIEFEQARLAAAGKHEDVTLGVRRDPGSFAHVETGRELEKVRRRIERNFWAGGLRFRGRRRILPERRRGTEQRDEYSAQRSSHVHLRFLKRSRIYTFRFPRARNP